jgi:xanthine/CO dehydrogenase XdhC/CoxF family maturation factor
MDGRTERERDCERWVWGVRDSEREREREREREGHRERERERERRTCADPNVELRTPCGSIMQVSIRRYGMQRCWVVHTAGVPGL